MPWFLLKPKNCFFCNLVAVQLMICVGSGTGWKELREQPKAETADLALVAGLLQALVKLQPLPSPIPVPTEGKTLGLVTQESFFQVEIPKV